MFTGRVREACGFDEDRANRLLVDAGALTGRVAEPILGRQAKLEALIEVAAGRGVPLAATLAVGDGANDAVMLARSGLGVGYRPKAPARAAADVSIDHGDLTALRYADWKLIFMEQKAAGTFRVWMEPFVPLRIPLIVNLRRDPYERALVTSNTYYDWLLDHAFLLVPAQDYVATFLASFKKFPPRQKAASFALDQVMEKLISAGGSK